MWLNTDFKFRLYVSGDSSNSMQAIANLNAICVAYLKGHQDTEVIDVFLEPKRAVADGIFMTPTLIRLMPQPVRRIVGTLSNTQAVLDALGLAPVAA
jgi:circadian clock protein KaiB